VPHGKCIAFIMASFKRRSIVDVVIKIKRVIDFNSCDYALEKIQNVKALDVPTALNGNILSQLIIMGHFLPCWKEGGRKKLF
jgi:endonuclease I